jgi:hypothetical protein
MPTVSQNSVLANFHRHLPCDWPSFCRVCIILLTWQAGGGGVEGRSAWNSGCVRRSIIPLTSWNIQRKADRTVRKRENVGKAKETETTKNKSLWSATPLPSDDSKYVQHWNKAGMTFKQTRMCLSADVKNVYCQSSNDVTTQTKGNFIVLHCPTRSHPES